MKNLFYITLIFMLCCNCRNKTGETENNQANPSMALQITNPVLPGDRPDPTVIQIGEYYYASATSNEWAPLFPIFQSTDLVEWELVNYVFPDGAPDWAKNNFWAPELSYDEKQNKIYAYYTARNKSSNRLSVAVASADSPNGKFTDHGPLVAQEYGSIDAFEVRDENGKPYVLWKEDGNSKGQPTPMWAQEINEERTRLLGEPKELFRNDQPWEKHLVEGIAIFRENGYFYATYSAGACCDKQCDYKAGVARSKTLLGPWEKYPGNPILEDNEDWKCAGHGTVVKKNGEHFLLYHAYNTSGSVFVGREGVLEKFSWTEDQWPVLENKAAYTLKKGTLGFTDTFDPDLHPLWQWRVTQDIHFTTGKDGLYLEASEENEYLGSLLVQGTKSTDYYMETILDLDQSDAEGGIVLVGAANNGFGAPVAAMGIGVGNGQIRIFETRDRKTEVFGEEKIPDQGKITLRMEVKNGHLLYFSYKTDSEQWKSLSAETDASHLVPWGMGFRLGMFAKGSASQQVNFQKTSIVYP